MSFISWLFYVIQEEAAWYVDIYVFFLQLHFTPDKHFTHHLPKQSLSLWQGLSHFNFKLGGILKTPRCNRDKINSLLERKNRIHWYTCKFCWFYFQTMVKTQQKYTALTIDHIYFQAKLYTAFEYSSLLF